MKTSTKRISTLALLLVVGLIGACGEGFDNIDSEKTCREYCSKDFDCRDHEASGSESDKCITACRDSIEDNCGNEHQAAANDRIGSCVDKSCVEFQACMVYDAAPECFSFVK